jgi:isoquinoline 1-oxidoreductase alpha subunit
MNLTVNGNNVTLDVDPQMPLLWVLRDSMNLTGTKFGCGVAACGACTVHKDGQAVRSCVTPVSSVAGAKIKTIESLGTPEKPHPLQLAWIDEQVPQCGYCQSGMLMAAAALLERKPKPTDADIDAEPTNACVLPFTAQQEQQHEAPQPDIERSGYYRRAGGGLGRDA